eukprot:TRINITY_DN11340_c0_g1_i2.p1 TRINITY_DN11340_c0_g1~~TRINITY_DN11340_c0_g1_i2.p1  ORF type:complete len:324 (-),score=44.27 TRINITY_DN11340_c0_g1_i2:105-1076(-)
MVLNKEKHIRFHLKMLHDIPRGYSSLECNHAMLVYFAVSALDVLGAIDRIENKEHIIEWMYSLQFICGDRSGFRGGHFEGQPFGRNESPHQYEVGHIAMTYVSLLTLRVLGDNLERVNREAILNGIRALQKPDGSFTCVLLDSECDIRFVFCASAISAMLNDWSGMDIDNAVRFIQNSQTYDGGFAQQPGMESHGGSTYCAVAALTLMGKLDAVPRRADLVRWCVNKQVGGFQGRTNKPADSCYSFWIGAALDMLGCAEFISTAHVRTFNCQCEYEKGGFGKWPQAPPDLVHAYFGLAGLSIAKAEDLLPLNCAIGATRRAVA